MTKRWQQVLICPKCWARESVSVERMTAPKPANVVCDSCRRKAMDAGTAK
jgi:hypothetical protein